MNPFRRLSRLFNRLNVIVDGNHAGKSCVAILAIFAIIMTITMACSGGVLLLFLLHPILGGVAMTILMVLGVRWALS
jgi:hypothetical protein